jgi:hypothetical protein
VLGGGGLILYWRLLRRLTLARRVSAATETVGVTRTIAVRIFVALVTGAERQCSHHEEQDS